MTMRWIAFAAIIFAAYAQAAPLMQSPSGERYTERNPGGETVLPNGRLITPAGPMVQVRPHPFGLALSLDGRYAVAVSNDGAQLSILDLTDPDAPTVRFFPDDVTNDDGVLDAAFMGLAISPDSKTVYVAGGSDWSLMAVDLATATQTFRLDCKHRTADAYVRAGYLGDLRLSPDGKTIYAVDQSNFRMLVIDVEKQEVLTSIEVGRYPFGIALSPDGTRAFVANVGMFEYSTIRTKDDKPTRLHFPPFGVPSDEAEEGVEIEDAVVPGLGSPNDILGMSVWTVDLTERGNERVIHKTKTGHLVGETLEDFPAVGGSSPNSIVCTEDFAYVSNGSNDSITVIDAHTGDRVQDIDLHLAPEAAHLRGVIPFGLALSPDKTRLYVAEAGINAVGVIRIPEHEFMGHIPTAWFPAKLAALADGKRLVVACAKGIGSGPNAGPNHAPGDPTGIGALMRGYVNIITLPEDVDAQAAATAQVVRNNVRFVEPDADPRPEGFPVPPQRAGAWASPIKHVIYVTKENRTYDEVFGALPGGRGSEENCRLGKPVDVFSGDGSRSVKDVVLMPNHIALARRFAISDNYYCDSDHSSDGHRWLVGTYPNEFMEARQNEHARGRGPGNFLFTGSSGAIYPEDYNEAGSIWEHFERSEVRFFNFGLGFEFAPGDEEADYTDSGIRLPVNYPMPQALFENTARDYATYNTDIPDQFRMDRFEERFHRDWASGNEPFPSVITIMLPNDHGAGERIDAGYPFWGSFMSDNDLALGRLVELISHSEWWHETAIFVTEDDAQGYTDTVDAHRSICMVISPYAKRDYISHTHASMGSILKTMFSILGMPALNQYDGCASDLADLFTVDAANAEPYAALPVHPEVFDPQKALDPYDKEFKWRPASERPPLDGQEYLDSDEYGHSGKAGLGPREPAAE
ncbi:MAG: hypothetical protein GC168_10040 [Candidatus Hydrogenedens sp.]|nr:hypothetical protein [Candidatus Hydrogenedens sp.]